MMNAKIYPIFLFCLLTAVSLKAQVGIGTNTPHESAQLEVSSDNKGVLMPRLTEAQRLAVANPADGLLVYQTDKKTGFYYYQSGKWNLLSADSPENNQAGDMQYWDGEKWINIAAGTPGQLLQLSGSGVPKWTSTAYQPGDTGPAGGLVFYDKGNYDNGWRYLELAPEVLEECTWGGCNAEGIWKSGKFNDTYLDAQGRSIAVDGLGMGAGRFNTDTILKSCPEAIPVKLAATYNGGGYTDWFLPSFRELTMLSVLFKQKTELQSIIPDYENKRYWTSSVSVNNEILLIYGYNIWEISRTSPESFPVLPVRRF